MAEYYGPSSEPRGRVPDRTDRDSLPNPITSFEQQLKVLDNSYLTFFEERSVRHLSVNHSIPT